MDGCKGMPLKNGFAKACPLRTECKRYDLHVAPKSKQPAGYREQQGPYDFDDEECGMYVEL